MPLAILNAAAGAAAIYINWDSDHQRQVPAESTRLFVSVVTEGHVRVHACHMVKVRVVEVCMLRC